jgi:SAM-dependent methyltransferase
MFVKYLDDRFYPGVSDHWDDQLFADFVRLRLQPAYNVLDLGAGAGVVPHLNFRGDVARVCGVDPDPRVISNPHLDDAKIGTGEQIPYGDEGFDLVFCDNVMEHLADPAAVLAEVARVLKPGGRFLFKTPNRRHYMPTVARLTPHWFHGFYNKLRGRAAADTFPTVYAANSPERMQELAAQTGFLRGEVILAESRPEYLRLSALTYLFGIAWERAVNAFPRLASYRILLIGELIKPDAPSDTGASGGSTRFACDSA